MQHFSNVLCKSRAYPELKGLSIFLGWFNLHNPSFSVRFLWLTNKKPDNLSCRGHFAGMTASELGISITDWDSITISVRTMHTQQACYRYKLGQWCCTERTKPTHPQLSPFCVRDYETCSLLVLIYYSKWIKFGRKKLCLSETKQLRINEGGFLSVSLLQFSKHILNERSAPCRKYSWLQACVVILSSHSQYMAEMQESTSF